MAGALFPAATIGPGQALGVPDVCKVPAPPAPPIPIPFPNLGALALAVNTSTTVMFANMPVITASSKLPLSNGDQAGVAGGVISGMIMGEVSFRTASSKVSVQGQKVVLLTAMTAHNGSNANMPAGVHMAPSQVKVLCGL